MRQTITPIASILFAWGRSFTDDTKLPPNWAMAPTRPYGWPGIFTIGAGLKSDMLLSRSTPRSPSRRLTPDNEVDVMRHISRVNPKHHGWDFIRKLHDSFVLEGKTGSHVCLVLDALREPFWIYQKRFIGSVIPSDTMKLFIRMILSALDYLHSECHIIHTDLKPGNIMIKAEDPAIFAEDAETEFNDPLAQKVLEDRIIYLERNNYGPLRKLTGLVEIIDFDLSVSTTPGQKHNGAIQSEIYRSPEVIVDSGYNTSADIWSFGVMLWDLLQGRTLFNPTDPQNNNNYDDLAHLAQISALLGPPPASVLSGGQRTSMFFRPDGIFKGTDIIPKDFNFENSIDKLSGEDKLGFLKFAKKMIRWDPATRCTAKELLKDPWLYEEYS